MRFIADAMLGRLAKWLRLLGFDVLYYPDMDDRLLVRTAREQDRILLTRDTGMLKRKGLGNLFFIQSDRTSDQILELKKRFALEDNISPARCTRCDAVLEVVMNKDDIRDYVPEYVYHTFSSFSRCSGCGRVYWEGSHYRNFQEKIREILR